MEWPSRTVIAGGILIVGGGLLYISGIYISSIRIPWTIGLGCFILAGTLLWGEMRYQSPQFITESVHGSFDDYDTDETGAWAIIPIGTVKAQMYYERGGLGTVIVPAKSLRWYGIHLSSHTCPEIVTMDQLPPEVVPIVIRGGAYKQPFWYSAIITPTISTPETNVASVSAENKALNQVINRLAAALGHDFRTIKSVLDLSGDISRLQKKGGIRGFMQKMKPEESEKGRE